MRRLLKFKYSDKEREVLVKYEVDGKASLPETITLESHEKPSFTPRRTEASLTQAFSDRGEEPRSFNSPRKTFPSGYASRRPADHGRSFDG